MRINPYLTFDGTCEAALTHYAGIFGGEIIDLMRFGDMPDTDWITDANRNQVAHAKLKVGDHLIMVSDSGGRMPHQGHHGFSMQIEFDTVAEGQTAFDRLADGGTVDMPYQATFWAAGFGMCHDKFGVPWMVNCDKA